MRSVMTSLFTDLPAIHCTVGLDPADDVIGTPQLRLQQGQMEMQARDGEGWLPLKSVTHTPNGLVILEVITEVDINGFVTHAFRRMDVVLMTIDEYERQIPTSTRTVGQA